MRGALLGIGLVAGILMNTMAHASPSRLACASPPPALGKYSPAQDGHRIPEVAFLDDTGNEKSLADYRGQGLVVNLWATWCAPCVKEMPALDGLAGAAGGQGLRVLPLSADREGVPVVRRFYELNNIRNLPIAIDRMSRVARAIGIDGLPTTVLYDADGHELGRVIGVAEWDKPDVVEFLGRCLAERG